MPELLSVSFLARSGSSCPHKYAHQNSALLESVRTTICLQISRSYFYTMANVRVMRFFRFRDISHIPDLIVYQHEICLQDKLE